MTEATSFALFIPGPPHGQGRPKVGINRTTGRPLIRTPKETRSYATRIGDEWITAGRPKIPKGPYAIDVYVRHERPAGHRNTKGELNAAARRAPYPGKPDLDNVVKGALDALVACGAIPDDRHLVSLIAGKSWSLEQGVEITVHQVMIEIPVRAA